MIKLDFLRISLALVLFLCGCVYAFQADFFGKELLAEMPAEVVRPLLMKLIAGFQEHPERRKRLQEALRSLEPEAAVEDLRLIRGLVIRASEIVVAKPVDPAARQGLSPRFSVVKVLKGKRIGYEGLANRRGAGIDAFG